VKRICCISDLHGHFPKIPDCDLLILGGDYCPCQQQAWWFREIFAQWLEVESRKRPIIGVAGNHDRYFERHPHVTPMAWTYLQDSGTEWNGLKIWGTPWQPRFFDWAFNLDEPDLAEKWKLIPDDTDILILHGPPYGYGDFSSFGNVHTGSPSLLERIEEIQPRLVVAGHIHSGYGRYQIGNTAFLSCSVVDERYRVANQPQVFEVP